MVYYFTILILGATVNCHSVALILFSDNPKKSLHEEAHVDEASEHKSPW